LPRSTAGTLNIPNPITARRIEDARISDGCFNRIGILYCPISFQCYPDAVASDFLIRASGRIMLMMGGLEMSDFSMTQEQTIERNLVIDAAVKGRMAIGWSPFESLMWAKECVTSRGLVWDQDAIDIAHAACRFGVSVSSDLVTPSRSRRI
jgi:hypothetical protein